MALHTLNTLNLDQVGFRNKTKTKQKADSRLPPF